MKKAKDFNEYLESYPPEVQKLVKQMRATIKKAAPQAVDVISYGMPAFKLNGRMLMYFAGHKSHIGFYPYKSAKIAFKKELSDYKGSVGTVQFPYNEPLPLQLITKMVKFRVKEVLEKEKMKKK